MQKKKQNLVFLFLVMSAIKIFYIYVNILMLPEFWSAFSFDRKIDLSNILFELVFFVACLGIYLKTYIKGSPISFLSTLLFCIYFVPNNSCMTLSSYSVGYFVTINVFCLLLFYLIGELAIKMSKTGEWGDDFFGRSKTLRRVFRVVTLITCIVTFGYVYLIGGEINFSKVFQEDTYDVRAQLADFYMQNTDGLLAYIMLIWTAFYSLTLILGLYLSFVYKNYIDSIIILITYFALYTLSMEKGLLMRPIIAVFISIIVRKKQIIKASELFSSGYFLLLIISWIEYIIRQESALYTVIFRRIAYMPAYLTHTYYEFFDTHAKYWFTRDFFQLEKFVRIFYPGQYTTSIVQTISDEIYDSGIPSPNTGLFAEAFAQAGYLGVFIFPPLVVIAFKYLYKCSKGFGAGAAMVILAQFSLSVTNIQLLCSRSIVQILVFVLLTFMLNALVPKTSKVR